MKFFIFIILLFNFKSFSKDLCVDFFKSNQSDIIFKNVSEIVEYYSPRIEQLKNKDPKVDHIIELVPLMRSIQNQILLFRLKLKSVSKDKPEFSEYYNLLYQHYDFIDRLIYEENLTIYNYIRAAYYVSLTYKFGIEKFLSKEDLWYSRTWNVKVHELLPKNSNSLSYLELEIELSNVSNYIFNGSQTLRFYNSSQIIPIIVTFSLSESDFIQTDLTNVHLHELAIEEQAPHGVLWLPPDHLSHDSDHAVPIISSDESLIEKSLKSSWTEARDILKEEYLAKNDIIGLNALYYVIRETPYDREVIAKHLLNLKRGASFDIQKDDFGSYKPVSYLIQTLTQKFK